MARDVVTLSLISHTNVGKTTLARTLLRREVGEVLDQAHVTEDSECHTLIETSGATLRLWDTPGFGDLTRLVKRLRTENEPVGWLLHQVWDRLLNRSLWCSQEAARNVKDEADVVLYLVNAAEQPDDAGYLPPELELLTWMSCPVILLLNQVGSDGLELEPRWREFAGRWGAIRDVLSLDAFTRCWVEESVLLERVVGVLDGPKRQSMQTLTEAWDLRNLASFRAACESMAEYLFRAAADHESPRSSPRGEDAAEPGMLEDVARLLKLSTPDRKRTMAALNDRLDRATRELMDALIAGQGLVGESAAKIEQSIEDYQVRGSRPIRSSSGAVAGAVVSGALGGLAADVLSGGLTLGGGVIAGGILGALGGAALARGYRLVGSREQPRITWAPQFLDQLTCQVVLRYLAVAHFGRGRGSYRDLERPARFREAVERALSARSGDLGKIWQRAQDSRAAVGGDDRARRGLITILNGVTRDVLVEAYPHATRALS
jgi:hypothetical protein